MVKYKQLTPETAKPCLWGQQENCPKGDYFASFPLISAISRIAPVFPRQYGLAQDPSGDDEQE